MYPDLDARARFEQLAQRSAEVATAQILWVDRYAPLSDEARERALNAFEYARNVPAAWPQVYGLLLALAPKMEMAGYREAWIERLVQGVACSQRQEQVVAEAELSLQIGYLYLLMSRWQRATEWLSRSRDGFRSAGESAGEGRALNRLAMVDVRQERLSAAGELVVEAQHLLKEDADLANSYFVLGTIAENRRGWQEAEHYYRQSLGCWRDQNDRRRTAWGLRNLGPVLREQQKYEEAIHCYEHALQVFAEIHDPINHSVTLMNLGNVHLHRHRAHQALKLYEEAEREFYRCADQFNLAKVYVNQGIAHLQTQSFAQAEVVLSRAAELWASLGNIKQLCNAIDGLGEIYRKQGDFEKAVQVLNKGLQRAKEIENPQAFAYYRSMLAKTLSKAERGDAS